MADAAYRNGYPVMVDYTAGADIVAGEMVLLGNATGVSMGIAHVAIANGDVGSLAIGGGVYDCMVASNYAAWSKVYKPSANAILTTTSTNNALFGYTVEAAGAANAIVKVLHDPII